MTKTKFYKGDPKCYICGKEFSRNGVQIYCGSYLTKTGCSYQRCLDRWNKRNSALRQTPEGKRYMKTYLKEWRRKYQKEYMREWRKNNKISLQQYNKEWKAEHRQRLKEM